MYTKVLDLIERDGLIFGCRNVGRRVVLWICTEGTDIDFSGGDGTVGVDLHEIRRWVDTMLVATYHDSNEWVLEFLVCHLSVDVDTR